MTSVSTSRWPQSVLAAAERAFGYLCQIPPVVEVDGRVIGHGLPARQIGLAELRRLLVHDPDTSFAAKDAAWHHVIALARGGDPGWVVAVTGLALPGLKAMRRRLVAGHTRQADDIESELLAGFLETLRHKDLTGPAPYSRLLWAGWRAALLVRGGDIPVEPPDLPEPSSGTPARPYGHPELILGRAVAAGVITAEQAELIGATRLDRVFVDDLAAAAGVDASVLRMRRRRAELALVKAMTAGRLDAGPAPRPHRRQQQRPHRGAVSGGVGNGRRS